MIWGLFRQKSGRSWWELLQPCISSAISLSIRGWLIHLPLYRCFLSHWSSYGINLPMRLKVSVSRPCYFYLLQRVHSIRHMVFIHQMQWVLSRHARKTARSGLSGTAMKPLHLRKRSVHRMREWPAAGWTVTRMFWMRFQARSIIGLTLIRSWAGSEQICIWKNLYCSTIPDMMIARPCWLCPPFSIIWLTIPLQRVSRRDTPCKKNTKIIAYLKMISRCRLLIVMTSTWQKITGTLLMWLKNRKYSWMQQWSMQILRSFLLYSVNIRITSFPMIWNTWAEISQSPKTVS